MVLLDGVEHSYWEVDEARLRADLRTGCGIEQIWKRQLVNDYLGLGVVRKP